MLDVTALVVHTSLMTATNTTDTYHAVRPVHGSMVHAGYEFPFTRTDGTTTINRGTVCSVTVQYRPGTSDAMTLAELAEVVDCPRCAAGIARIIARQASK